MDATGRYYTVPASVQRAYYALMHTIVGVYYTNGAGVFSALFILQVFLGP